MNLLRHNASWNYYWLDEWVLNGFLWNADSHSFLNTLFRPCFHEFAVVVVASDLMQNVTFWKKKCTQRQDTRTEAGRLWIQSGLIASNKKETKKSYNDWRQTRRSRGNKPGTQGTHGNRCWRQQTNQKRVRWRHRLSQGEPTQDRTFPWLDSREKISVTL